MPGLPALLLLTCCLELLDGAPSATPQSPRSASVTAQGDKFPDSSEVTRSWSDSPSEKPASHYQSSSGVKGQSLPTQSSFHQTETPSFILDLQRLSEVNLSSENPNIQVTIEVGPDSQTEFELDLSDSRTDWTDTEWVSQHELFWPLFWEYNDLSEGEVITPETNPENAGDYSSQYEWEDNVLSGVGGNIESHAPTGNNWLPEDKYQYDYEEEDWSPWSPCSATCGSPSQKRTRSCGYSCTATESRICDLPLCPGEEPTENWTPGWVTTANTGTPAPNSDSCDRWLTCKSDFLSGYLHRVLTELPNCPCSYPSEAVYSSLTLRDDSLGRSFRWRDASGGRERLDIYNPGATFCLRSLLSRDSSSLGAQHCCYDQSMRLLTRGRGAGTPNLISADFSPELHYKADVLPWILCKGDWSRIHALRPPNNGRACQENPPEEEYLSQLQEAREY
ncbi:isthmin-2 [Pelodytes ibericus]